MTPVSSARRQSGTGMRILADAGCGMRDGGQARILQVESGGKIGQLVKVLFGTQSCETQIPKALPALLTCLCQERINSLLFMYVINKCNS